MSNEDLVLHTILSDGKSTGITVDPDFDIVFPDEHGCTSLVPRGSAEATGYAIHSRFAKLGTDALSTSISVTMTTSDQYKSPSEILEQLTMIKEQLGPPVADLRIVKIGDVEYTLDMNSMRTEFAPEHGLKIETPISYPVTFNFDLYRLGPYTFKEFALYAGKTRREIIRDQVKAHQKRKNKRAARARTGRR